MRAAVFVLLLAAAAPSPPVLAQPASETADPEAEWQRLNGLTQELLGKGDYAGGADVAKRSLAFAEARFGADHLHTMTSANNLAFAYDALGRYAEAEPLYRRALAIVEKTLGPDHPETLVPVNNLGLLLAKQGRYKEAEPLYRRAVEGSERALGPDHSTSLVFLANLANLLALDGRYAESEPLYRKGFAAAERVLGPDHQTTLAYADNLGGLFQRLGRYSEAETMFARALAGREAALGADHPHTLSSVSSLAALKAEMDRPAEAEPLFRRALAGRERAFGPDHPETLQSMTGLAQLHEAQGRFGEAVTLHAKVLAARERVLGFDHPDTIVSANNVAVVKDRMGLYAEAEPLFRRAIEGSERAFGRDHPNTLTFLSNQGQLYHHQGRWAEAERLFRRALDAREQRLGRDHPETLQTLANLGTLLIEQGRTAEAEPMFLRALEAGERAHGRDHKLVLLFVNNLAALYDAQARYAESEPLQRRALESAERLLGSEHPETLQYLSNLAVSYVRRGEYGQAEPLLRRALAAREKVAGAGHRDTIQAILNLAVLRRRQDDHEEGETLLRRAVAASGRALGADHPDTLRAEVDLASQMWARGRASEAEPLYARAIPRLDRTLGPDHPQSIRAAAQLAFMQLRDSARAAAALDPARRVVTALRERRRLAASDPFAEAQAEREQAERWEGYTLLADAAWAAGRDSLAGEAFTALQDSAAGTTDRAVARMAARGAADRAGPGLGALARERQDLSEQWAATAKRHAEAYAATGPDSEALREALRAERARTEARMEEVDRRLRAEFPAYFALVRPEAMDVEAVRAMLGQDEALLLAVPTEFGTHVVAVGKDGLRWARSGWTRERTDAAVRRLLWDAGASVEVDPAQAFEWQQAAEAGSFDRKTAHALYEQLIAPVADVLAGKKQVFIAASGSLSGLPFGILVAEAPQGSDSDAESLRATKWFADAHALVRIPSVQSLQFLRLQAGVPSGAGQGFIGFGDPALRGKAEARGRGSARRSGAAIADPTRLASMARLPGTAVELENLRQALRAPASSLFLGERATEKAVRTTDLKPARILALATHGLMAGEAGSAEPGLVFTPPATPGPEDDGLLTASEVAALRLDADWVIMSACNTAAGDGSAGAPGLSGLARAFFYAGARNLLASHWPVGDEVAPRLTVRTFELLAADPKLSRAEAFQRAMREVREDRSHDSGETSWAHPAAWAPFSLIGDGAR